MSPYTETEVLPAGYQLSVVANAASSGSVRRVAEAGTTTQYNPTAVPASTTVTVGPFNTARVYEVQSDSGLLTYSKAVTESSTVTTSSGMAAQITDESGTGAMVFGTGATLTTPTLSAPTVTAASFTQTVCANVTTLNAGNSLTIDANSQAAIYSQLTVAGTLTVAGELRVTPWPN